nr:PREDICTED: thromboxane A2 receptor isoform X2 [Paralichthys olivaceus]XP_019953850.1 PREDICTED: thromboxane A2 receptor isoform X2 [Paralichthys olivaceus]XP_019953851.1 PREDICTED: thromboxane A2 receptor isoform X2 [Paralichthys olivaceus]XP_019953852.1 PREDICTED: thromboxane A2 receptor isoform X2 [Paralichthys olivaceus]XP_019953853.1 PREDICTED: thromboxane A2 receptor isoform X2 [Paralichthys olivaceus]XP_019953854.1 PREDICTED: thromboxane A2 receptor isoform X2 [Paralichthys olivaceus]
MITKRKYRLHYTYVIDLFSFLDELTLYPEVEERNEIPLTGTVVTSLNYLKSTTLHPLATMNSSVLPLTNSTPLCYTKNSPPFTSIQPPIASAYYSSIFMILGLTSNLVAFVVLLKSFQRTQSRSRSFFLIFLGGLVVTDFMGLLLTGTIVVSFHVTHFNWRHLDPNCHFCNFMGMSMVFYGLCPLLLSASMALERFIGINWPFARSSSVSKSRTISMVLMVWFIAGCIALLPLTGVGAYHLQVPGSWCFLNISSEGNDLIFSLIFSFVGLISIAVSFLLNTISVVTLIKVCCGQDRSQRRRDHEVEMMVQLILIMVIASICWCPLLIFIAETVLSGAQLQVKYLLLWLRFATGNQILDPWVYILFRRAVLKRIYPRFDWSRGSIMTLYPSLRDTVRRLTRSSIGSTVGSNETGETGKLNVTPPSTLNPPPSL